MVRRQLGTCFGKMLGTVATPIGAIQCDAQNVDDPGDGVLALIDQCVAQGAQFAHRVRQSREQDFNVGRCCHILLDHFMRFQAHSL